MINLKNIQNQKWLGINISILGAGKSGISAAKLCKFIGAKPFISESKNDVKLKEILSNFNYEIGGHSNKVLNSLSFGGTIDAIKYLSLIPNHPF